MSAAGCLNPCFNSKLVRLKVLKPGAHPQSRDSFQFQTGAIKRSSASRSNRLRNAFQFQTGAIKTYRTHTGFHRSDSFNSKLVRLKARAGTDEQPEHEPRFNSKLVRLKAGNARLGYTYLEFQFQTGAIKRTGVIPPQLSAVTCFNSKLVRLKVMQTYI